MVFKRMIPLGLMALLAVSVSLSCVAFGQSPLTSAKPTLDGVIRTLDPSVKLREDSLVTFSDGTQYVLVQPGEPSYPEQLAVTRRLPENKQPADIIVFNDGHYLLRILTLPGGQKTFPVLPEIPDELKTGMLAQNFAFPQGFFLPTQWKALTGNLLVRPENAMDQSRKPQAPLIVSHTNPERLTIWNPALGAVTQDIPLTFKPTAILASPEGKTLWMGAPKENKLYAYSLADEKFTTLDLPKPVSSLALDSRLNRLFIAHPNHHGLSVLDVSQQKFLAPMELPYVAGDLVISPMRSKLFVTVPSDKKHADTEEIKTYSGLGRFFLHPSRLDAMQAEKEAEVQSARKPALQIINTATLELERVTPALDGITRIYNQDEKLLWIYSPENKALQAFDMRWQEFAEPLTLEETPADFASDGTWLYVLLSQQNVLARLNTKTMMWGSAIALEPGATAHSLVYDAGDNQALVLANNPNGIQVLNLNRGEWVGTQQTAFAGVGKLMTLGDGGPNETEQVRIKFQNGRVLRQTVQGLQWEKWLSGPHAPQNSQGPQGPSETPSAP